MTLGGKRVADAKPVDGFPAMLALTFAPPKEADLLVVVSRKGASSPDATYAFDVSIASGAGRPPSLAFGKPRTNRKAARR